MINLSPETRLSIILPNTNKALSEAIKNATPEQLETLKEGKDIKSLLTSAFQDKTTASKSDQILLDLLKNSTAFKNMGNFGDTLRSLVQELKAFPDTTLKTAVFENFFKNSASIDPQSLKSQIASSGIFMESKIAAALQKMPDLIQTLEQLKTALAKSPLSEAKTLYSKITALLEDPIISKVSTHPPSAVQLSEGLKKLTDILQTLMTKNDPLFSKDVAVLGQKLEQQGTLTEIKSTLSQLYGTLLSSKMPDADSLLDSIEKLLKNLTDSSKDEIKTFALQLRNAQENDPSKTFSSFITKLAEFTDPKTLVTETFLKESMENDLKSNLLALHEELSQSDDPSNQKLLEQTDKLLTQIDYHQLVSHLSSSNSIYFPFVWDQLQEGSLSFKKTKDKKFYCDIHLTLKEFGELDLMMALYDENQLEIQAHTEKPELKSLIYANIAELRSLLITSGLTPRSIRVFDATESKTPLNETYASSEGSDMGFEVKV